MGEIENARHAVDQREPERDQRVQPAQQDAADQQLDDDGRSCGERRAGKVHRAGRRADQARRRGRDDPTHCQDGDGQIILPVACSCGHTTTGSPFCI